MTQKNPDQLKNCFGVTNIPLNLYDVKPMDVILLKSETRYLPTADVNRTTYLGLCDAYKQDALTMLRKKMKIKIK